MAVADRHLDERSCPKIVIDLRRPLSGRREQQSLHYQHASKETISETLRHPIFPCPLVHPDVLFDRHDVAGPDDEGIESYTQKDTDEYATPDP